MRKFSTFVVLFITCGALFAQSPLNDDCSGLIDLGPAPFCETTVFSNENATATNIGNDNNPTCFNSGVAQRDVWFAFTCPDTLFDFRITVTGVGANSIVHPEFAIYRGDCTFDGLAELLCAKADIGENALFLDVAGLTPGLQYFIRVSDYSVTATPNSGDFTLCVTAVPPTSNVDDGGSTLCEGILYDTGGPDGDYGANEDHTFVICPTQPSGCINFTLDYFNIENGTFFSGDFLTFYDGEDTNAPILGELGGDGGFGSAGGGGGVCFQVLATSGCLTIQFQSDDSNEFEGWQGHWECTSQPCVQPVQLNVSTTITNEDIVNAVATPATTVTVTNINCPSGAYGTFNFATDNNELGLGKGLLLTSGDANLALGPNDSPSATFAFDGTGDPDLDYLSEQLGNGTPSTDACIVELDVFVATDELSFEYVFGSEEYPEFVDSDFNDIFAFLISGPGIAGDPSLSNNARNIAVVPGTNTPVQINSVNNLLNWQYYRNNFGSTTLQYDGLTSDSVGVKKSLTARSAVTPCNTYHLKLAVADRQDFSYDSGVFVSEIKGATPNLAVQFASGIEYFIEDCSGNEDQLIISLSEPLEEESSFVVTVGGTATLGLDYLLTIPSLIVFPAGVTELSFPIAPITDALVEGTETITITLSNNFGCGTVVYKTLTIEIKDNVEVEVTGGDTLFVCAGNTLQLLAEGATNYFWAPPGAVSNPFIANPTITPDQDIVLVVTGTIGACVDVDSVLVRIVDPMVDVTIDSADICLGGSVPLLATNNVNNQGLSWSPVTGLNNPNIPNPVATPTVTTTYIAKITIAGCFVTDSVTITVDTLHFPVLNSDTTVCQNYPVVLASNTDSTSTTYLWTPATGLSSDTTSSPVALPDATTTYTLVATSANGACSQTESITVTIIAADVDILGDPYLEICLGEPVPLVAQSSPAGAQVVWSPGFYVSNPTGPTTTANPDESVTIFATYTVNNCVVRDSIQIRVDSLPESAITRVEDKELYCPGDTIFLISPTYEPANFPDIQINWPVYGGELTPEDNWNLVLLATSTHTFERIVVNRACVDTSRAEIPVGIIPTITTSANPTAVCPGQQVQLMASVTPQQALEWEEVPGISCTMCPNPIVTPLATTSYSVSAPDAECPANASITVVVQPAPFLALPQNPSICLGGSVTLNNGPSEPGVTYTWTSLPAGFISGSANPLVMPTQNTTYRVLADGLLCDTQGEVIVTVANATVNAGADQDLCIGETAALTAVVTGTTGQITWNPGNQSGNSIQVMPTLSTTYTATLLYGPGCVATDQVLVTVVAGVTLTPIATDPGTEDSLCAGTPIILKVTPSPADAELLWSENGNPLAGQTSDSIQLFPGVTEGVALYTVVATNDFGCSATRSVSFNLRRCLVIPNAFTPGNDEFNDTFGVVLAGDNIQIVEFLVYNRWGQKVFEATPTMKRWDGNFDGDEAPSDVYVYYIKVRYPDGTEDGYQGDVTLLR